MNSNFPKVMKATTAVTVLATAVLTVIYHFSSCGWVLSAAITTGTIFYHFAMRLVDNCCISEAVHEVIVLFSFVPLLFTLLLGAFPVFLITSVLAAAFDSYFILMQRYNRPRLVRILAKKEASGL